MCCFWTHETEADYEARLEYEAQQTENAPPSADEVALSDAEIPF
jgi:hypothetical protein